MRSNQLAKEAKLIPVFDDTLQSTRNHFTRLLGMPVQTGGGTALFPPGHDLMVHLARLPVPETDIAAAVTGRDELAVGRDLHINSVPSVIVAPETLLAVLPEFVRGAVHDDLVVAGLEGDVLTVWMGRGARQGEHVGLGDELDGHGDAVLPGAQGLVVRGGDEAAVFVDEGDGVDGCQVVVVFLDQLAGARVELHDLLVGHAGQELV